ncbi:MAG: carbohydrate kinase [Candidatus Hydrogenedens sp.]|nr:carbohydrate kinase [Candidatus Hydrogenedens sp.]
MSSAAEQYVLAIDLGTSGPKVGVVSASGVVAGSAFRPVQSFEVEDGGSEQDPEAVWRAVVEASCEALEKSGVARDAVAAVICDSHFFSIAGIGRDGKPSMNLLVWMDRRGRAENLNRAPGHRADSLWRQFQWWRIHGVPPLASGVDDISKLRWLRHYRPEVYERTAVFLEPMDYINYRLTGRATANLCSAFPLQHTDNRSLAHTEYDDTLLRYSGMDQEKLPELVPLDAVIGGLSAVASQALGLPRSVQVVTGVNDTQAGAVGCAAFQGSHAGIVLGSSGVYVSHAEKKKTDVLTGLFTLPSPVAGKYLMTGEGGVSGRALEHFLESLLFADDGFGRSVHEDPYGRLEAAAASSPPGSNGVLFLPWLNGSIAPINDEAMRGGFLNVSLGTRRVDLARAVLEGIAFQYHQLAGAARRFTGRSFSHHVLYGGGALSNTWAQIMADVLQSPVHRMAAPRLTNCLGLGMLAFERLGRVSFDEIAQRVPIEGLFEPKPALRALYEDKNAAMTLAFKQNRRVFRKLNQAVGSRTTPGTVAD